MYSRRRGGGGDHKRKKGVAFVRRASKAIFFLFLAGQAIAYCYSVSSAQQNGAKRDDRRLVRPLEEEAIEAGGALSDGAVNGNAKAFDPPTRLGGDESHGTASDGSESLRLNSTAEADDQTEDRPKKDVFQPCLSGKQSFGGTPSADRLHLGRRSRLTLVVSRRLRARGR